LIKFNIFSDERKNAVISLSEENNSESEKKEEKTLKKKEARYNQSLNQIKN
jgi:hypothetical protein